MRSRNSASKLKQIILYGSVGLVAASVHALVLIFLSKVIALWASNIIAFLLASLTSYLGHAFYTFKEETKGNTFAKRWLIIQFISNISISGLLPILLSQSEKIILVTLLLVSTPTLLNFFIWSQAAKFSAKRQKVKIQNPLFHADDLGLTYATNKAIINLAEKGLIDSASIMMNGEAVEHAIQEWQSKVDLPLTLHLNLTEGKSLGNNNNEILSKNGILNGTFIKLLILSFLPKKISLRRVYEEQILNELICQVNSFKERTGIENVSLDGHQHIHLVPIVLDSILLISSKKKINWVRTTYESIPQGLSLNSWINIIIKGGFIKWIILQILSLIAKHKIKGKNIKTNSGFSGILLTGRMSKEAIMASINELKVIRKGSNETLPLVLTHPAKRLTLEEAKGLFRFPYSIKFLQSKWREKEWEIVKGIKTNINRLHELHE